MAKARSSRSAQQQPAGKESDKMLQNALGQISKAFGEGSIMRLADAADQQIEVELLSASTKPSVTNVEDKRGVLAWDLKLEPDEEHDITLAYRLSWPKEKTVRYMEQW